MSINISEGVVNAPGSQWNALGPGGIVNNGTTNINPTYNLVTQPAPVGPQPIDILREQACAGAAFDSAERGDPPRCHPETRTAVLSSGRKWADTFNTLCLFMWITGWAGVGKSAILQTLAELYSKSGRLAASFFFFQASHNRNSTSGFVATIAEQLMDSVPGAREIILDKIAKNPQIFVNKSFQSQWETLIVNTLCHPTVRRPVAPMLIVIDGVDEIASHDEQRILLQTILSTAPQLGPSYKFLFASRPEQQLERVFKEFGIRQESRIELGNGSGTQADIGLFLEASFSEIRYAYDFQSTSSTQAWPGQNVIKQLVNKASGQFVYASTVIRFVGSQDDPQAALDLIIKGRDVHAEAVKELDSLYLVLMKRVEGSIEKKNQHVLHHLLVCIYMHLVSKVGDEHHLLHPGASKSLLKTLLGKLEPILGTNGEYRHKSFIEFLIQPSAPHIFSINSWHISGVISLCLPVFLGNHEDKRSLLCFLERASPTPDLVSCLSEMPEGELSSWDHKVGCKKSGYLWDDKWRLGWLRCQFFQMSE
ncbi:hypothetical protein BDN72DRAFT_263420 [Pluteus cervinus]|uniref:Uncharacterized protein n=1 Tax=Pluteus cervinus TaxID=181527 RepID=A0ACD3AFS4_9AGAR|nr:hypothetical protein BDN72DRAFT_263420 [Pluteus cervinus]